MNSRSKNILLLIFGCCLIAGALAGIDGMIAANQMNPLPAAETAVAQAGWEVETLRLDSFEVSARSLGSSARVTYRVGEGNDAKPLEVHLRRPLFSRHWKAVSVEPR